MRKRIDAALVVAEQYGTCDGDHHKMWVIDQMVRALTGESYGDWVADYEAGGNYEWDEGIAP